MNYTDEMKELEDYLDGYEKKGYERLVAAFSALEYAQWIEKLDFDQSKELMYRFVEHMLHPEWND